MSIGGLVGLLAKHRLISSPLHFQLLQELVLSEHSLLDEELTQCIGLGQAGDHQLLVAIVASNLSRSVGSLIIGITL